MPDLCKCHRAVEPIVGHPRYAGRVIVPNNDALQCGTAQLHTCWVGLGLGGRVKAGADSLSYGLLSALWSDIWRTLSNLDEHT
jgi:hypothetical protein